MLFREICGSFFFRLYFGQIVFHGLTICCNVSLASPGFLQKWKVYLLEFFHTPSCVAICRLSRSVPLAEPRPSSIRICATDVDVCWWYVRACSCMSDWTFPPVQTTPDIPVNWISDCNPVVTATPSSATCEVGTAITNDFFRNTNTICK